MKKIMNMRMMYLIWKYISLICGPLNLRKVQFLLIATLLKIESGIYFLPIKHTMMNK